MRDLADAMRAAIAGSATSDLARLLHEGWELKRSLGFGITTGPIDEWYEPPGAPAPRAASCSAPAAEVSCF